MLRRWKWNPEEETFDDDTWGHEAPSRYSSMLATFGGRCCFTIYVPVTALMYAFMMSKDEGNMTGIGDFGYIPRCL